MLDFYPLKWKIVTEVSVNEKSLLRELQMSLVVER